MSIFQSTVITKYLKGQNSEIITAKWNDHFKWLAETAISFQETFTKY